MKRYAKLVLVVLLWGCEDWPFSERQEPPRTVGEASMNAAGERSKPCGGAEPCAGQGPARPQEAPVGLALSPSQRFTLTWPTADQVPHIEVHDARQNKLVTRITVDAAVANRVSASRARWTVGDNILLTWGAGTNAASAVLYDTRGGRLLEVDASAITVSPSMQYLALYPALLADDPVIEVYDLATGRQVARKAASEDTAWTVQTVEWQGQQLIAKCRDVAGQMQEVRIPLDASPPR
jgi:hypothetical protein